jgi:hypothetical protein
VGIDAADGGVKRVDEAKREGRLRGTETHNSTSDPVASVPEWLAGSRKEAPGIVLISPSERGDLRGPHVVIADAVGAQRHREPCHVRSVVTTEELERPDGPGESAVAGEQSKQVALIDGVRRGRRDLRAKATIGRGVTPNDRD